MSKISKQVIVIRKDLRNSKGEKIRTGKIVSQGSHACLKAVLDQMIKAPVEDELTLYLEKGTAIHDWVSGEMFTKITVYVNSEAELLDVYNKAKEKGLICSLITDAGLTEFNNVPTLTCCAIGPAWSDEVDEITGNLQLL